jgi:BirA family biotin operon repressor/biotin-[acetyl-CoA-carboxylase] ligase
MSFEVESVRARFPQRRIEWYEVLGSTMTIAGELAREGAPSGTVVGADEQTAGMGRLGRKWDSQPESGLYVSIILRLMVQGSSLPLTMLALGLASKESIEALADISPDLRWPNDLLIAGHKCAGILALWEHDAIVAGIGINVSQTLFPANLETPATSLLLRGAKVRREDLLIQLLESIDRWTEMLTRHPEEILRRFAEASSYAKGRRVRVDQPGRTLEGVTCGLDPSGFLLVREDNGAQTTILAGGVRPA